MSGPEMSDIATMMGALEGVHSCRVEFRYTTLGQAHNGITHIECSATFATLPQSDLPRVVTVVADWPSGKARTFEGLLYNLLWQLDYAIGQAYEQMTISTS